MRDTAADARVRLEAGQPLTEVRNSFAERFGAQAGQDLQDFVATLIEHELLREADATPVDFVPVTVAAYFAPKLDIYTDMQELLLLDPVHDVDETGWPAQRKHDA